VIRLLLVGGLAGEIATWSPLVQALAVITGAVVILVITLVKSDEPAKRLVAVIQAVRGDGSRHRQREREGGSGATPQL
jgi:hypothetical protein